MSANEMVVFNDYIMPVISQMLPQRVEALNEAAPGIQLTSAGIVGDFFESSFYNALYDNVRRVDPYATNSSVAAVDLDQGQHNSVKIHGGFGPIRFEPKQFRILQKPTQEGVTVIASQFVDAWIQDQLNTVIAGLVASIQNVSTLTYDESTAGGLNPAVALNQRGLNRSHALLGDRSQRLNTQIMRGGMDGKHGLIDEALANGTRLFTSGTVQVIDILGKRSVITDAPSLTADAGATTKVLTLVDGASVVSSTDEPITNIETKNGNNRIESTWQTDYDFTVGIKAMSWDEVNGGKAPSDAEIATGSNWDLVEDDKNGPGVIYVADVG